MERKDLIKSLGIVIFTVVALFFILGGPAKLLTMNIFNNTVSTGFTTSNLLSTPRYCWLPQFYCCCNVEKQQVQELSLQGDSPPDHQPFTIPSGGSITNAQVTVAIQGSATILSDLTVKGEGAWYYAPAASSCSAFSYHFCRYPFGIGNGWTTDNCNILAIEDFKITRWRCVPETAMNSPVTDARFDPGTKFYTWNDMSDRVWFWNHALPAPGISVTAHVYNDVLSYGGTAASCSGMNPVPNAIGCGYPANFKMVDQSNVLIGSGSELGKNQCKDLYSDSLRTVCGYVEDTCTSDSQCALRYPDQVTYQGRTLGKAMQWKYCHTCGLCPKDRMYFLY